MNNLNRNPILKKMQLFHSYYDSYNNILYGNHYSGFYSCINEVRNSLLKLISSEVYPEKISFINTLHWYRNSEDLYPFLYKMSDIKDVPNFNFEYFCPTDVKLEYLYINIIKIVNDIYFQPSDQVKNRINELENKYDIKYSKTLAVLHRGTDKYRESVLGSNETWLKYINDLNIGDYKILLQTDDIDTKNYMIENLLNDFFMFEDESIYSKNHVTPYNNKLDWAITFEAIMRIISKCEYIITHSGNTGIIPILYRGNLSNVHQWYSGGYFKNFDNLKSL